MTRDELEFSISQYLDGTLAAAQRSALEEHLATDAPARQLFAEYQSLQGALASSPVPQVQWDRFAAEISSAIASEELPAQSYKLNAWLRPARLAIAASVLLGIGVAFSLLSTRETGSPAVSEPVRIVRVDGTDGAVASATSQQPVQIAISAPASFSSDDRIVLHFEDEGIVQRPSRAMIVSAVPPAQDTLLTPF